MRILDVRKVVKPGCPIDLAPLNGEITIQVWFFYMRRVDI